VQLRGFLNIKQKDTPHKLVKVDALKWPNSITNQPTFLHQWKAHFIGCPSTYKNIYKMLQIRVLFTVYRQVGPDRLFDWLGLIWSGEIRKTRLVELLGLKIDFLNDNNGQICMKHHHHPNGFCVLCWPFSASEYRP